MKSLFLIFAGYAYEGNRILSTHNTVETAITEVERLQTEDDFHWDHMEVRAIAPGQGGGVTVAFWSSSYIEEAVEDDGPPCPVGSTSIMGVTKFVWNRSQ